MDLTAAPTSTQDCRRRRGAISSQALVRHRYNADTERAVGVADRAPLPPCRLLGSLGEVPLFAQSNHAIVVAPIGVIQQGVRGDSRGCVWSPAVVPADDCIRRGTELEPAFASATQEQTITGLRVSSERLPRSHEQED